MTNPKPVRDYVSAQEAIRRGDRDAAAEFLAKAVDSQPDNRVLYDNVDAMLSESPIGDLVIGLVVSESRRKRDGF